METRITKLLGSKYPMIQGGMRGSQRAHWHLRYPMPEQSD